ncbi:MAG TPA: hypothetical protein VGQ71_03330, partial [Terriglobales bacterium]|nr:hypothetical protein [Terriglobales bacterium]
MDTYLHPLQLGANEERTLNVPLLLFPTQKGLLRVEARDKSGNVLGRDRRELGDALSDRLVLILCSEQAACQQTQAQISFSGTAEEQSAKNKTLRFAAIREPLPEWWIYAVADFVVVAPGLSMSSQQQQAQEMYVRQGGRLVLLQERRLLAEYQTPREPYRPAVVGMGSLYRVGGLNSGGLGQLFSGGRMEAALRVPMFQPAEMTWARKRLATSFKFPPLSWLLLWVAAYIILVAPINFVILSRLRRREWGWLTVPLVSVLFSAALYIAGSANRPKTFGLDETTVYWMDDRSPTAAAEVGLRISAPQRKKLELQFPSGWLFLGGREPGGDSATGFGGLVFGIGTVLGPNPGSHLSFGEPQTLLLSLLRWSFQDVSFRTAQRTSGSVALRDGRLRNQTGKRFRDSIYVDQESVYLLGALAPDGEIELATTRKESLRRLTGRALERWGSRFRSDEERRPSEQTAEDWERELKEQRELPQRPFSLL